MINKFDLKTYCYKIELYSEYKLLFETKKMAVDYKYLNNSQGVLISAYGIAEGADLVNNMENIFKDPNSVKNYKYGICDFSAIEKFNISHNEIFALSKIHIKASKLNPQISVGFAISSPTVYGLVRIWTVYAETTGWTLKIKKDLPSIKKWIEETLALKISP